MAARFLANWMTFAATSLAVLRTAPTWKLRWQMIRAFQAGRRFYDSYPHLVKDIACGDRPRQRLDVYWPPNGDRHPVLFFVHGGSWSRGDKSLYALAGRQFTARGHVVVACNYSLYPDAAFPAFVEDVAAALAWTARHIAEYHGDPDRLFAAGHSAGGHILALIALDDRYLAAHGLTRGALGGVIVISAPTDLDDMRLRLDERTAAELTRVMGGPQQLPQADPIRHARPDAPPLLIVHGARDELVPVAQAHRFAAALRAAGAPVQLRVIDDADHFSIVLDGARSRPGRSSCLLSDLVAFTQSLMPQP